MQRLIQEWICEFKKYERDMTKEEIVISIFNEVKLIYSNVEKRKVQEEVEKYF
jgi:hypothetical protein